MQTMLQSSRRASRIPEKYAILGTQLTSELNYLYNNTIMQQEGIVTQKFFQIQTSGRVVAFVDHQGGAGVGHV